MNKYLPTVETLIVSMVVQPEQGTAVGAVKIIWRAPPIFNSKATIEFMRLCVCHDIARREFRWTEVGTMSDYKPKDRVARALSRRLRKEITNLVGEGKLDGSIIRRCSKEYRQPTA